ncbi:MAG: TMEM165/GDT1 family protein [Acidimicrobiales bacterium]
MHLAIIAAVYPLVFLGELPDKTMFASLVLASRGRPLSVWIGAATAFVVHVVIAVAIGVALFHLLPHRVVDGVVAALFAAGAVYAWVIRNQTEEEHTDVEASSPLKTALTAGVVIFIAEWGDLTQVVTANLAARYHSPLSVGVAAVLALWSVAALAVVGGQGLLRIVSIKVARVATAIVLLVLAVLAALKAFGV